MSGLLPRTNFELSDLSRRGLVPLRHSTWWRLATLLLGVVLAVMALLVLMVVEPLTHNNARTAFASAASGVTRSLDAMQASTRLTLQEGRRWWRFYSPLVDDPYAFNSFFRPLLAVNPLATSVVAGQEDGRGWLLLQLPDGGWRNRLTDVARWGDEQHILVHGPDGHIDFSTQRQPYDARQRPWYTLAMALEGDSRVAWTPPYTFFTTGEPGITASVRLGPWSQDRQQMQDGVLGVDLKLRDLSQVTMAAEVGIRGLATVLTDDGRVLALPRNTTVQSAREWSTQVLRPVADLGIPALQAGAAFWQNGGRQPLDAQAVSVGGQTWLLTAQPYDLGLQRLWVLTLAPEADFAPPWGRLLGIMLGAVCLVLLPVAWLVQHQTRKVVGPLEALARNTERIGRLGVDAPTEPVESPILEVHQLASAHAHMVDLLSRQQHALGAQIQALESAQSEIHQLAYYDPLTRLPNRRLLLDRLGQALARCQRSYSTGVLLYIDLDNFKTLNDTLGHTAGDVLLQTVAQRLLACLRQADTVARLGGDEFLVLLEDFCPREVALLHAPDANGPAQIPGPDLDPAQAAMQRPVFSPHMLAMASAAAHKIRLTLGQPATVVGTEFVITPSIGVVPFVGDESAEHILKWADMAMYRAKAAGRNGVCFFDADLQDQAERRVQIEADLRQALRRGELAMWLQPQFDAMRRPVGAEALVRWHQPQRGMVSPVDFIPVAESAGLIVPLGQWMLEQACAQLVVWSASAVSSQWTLSVNVSARQFRHPEFVDHILRTLQATGANPQRLRLELTESMLLDDIQQTVDRMAAMRQLGVGFSLDDFGTGYSSLAYLQRLPFVELKVDQSFVRDLLNDASDAVLTHTMIVLAHSLGLSVLAEGVETDAQFQALAADGCDLFQGYLLGRPVPVETFQCTWATLPA